MPDDSVALPLALFGRLHPVVLHLPIGLLGALVVMELWRWWRGEPELPAVALGIAWLNALTGVIAAATGLVLAMEPGYAGTTLDRHRLLGILLGALCLAVAIGVTVTRRQPRHRWYWAFRLSLAAAAVTLLPAGHLGASMTHGADFLTAPMTTVVQLEPRTVMPDSGLPVQVEAILERTCTACHGEARSKGLLALHTLNAVLAGGETGPVLVPGAPEQSELLRRMELPLDDDDHMPPEGKPQPTAEDRQVIREWIAEFGKVREKLAGAAAQVADQVAGQVATQVPVESPATSSQGHAAPEAPAPTADPQAVARLRARLAHVQPVANDSPFLWIDFAAAGGLTDEGAAELLKPLVDVIGDLSLARTSVGDATMALLATMPHLRRLDLRDTAVTDAGIAALAGHARLEELVLSGTATGDAALDSLRRLPALRSAFVWRTKMTSDALVALRGERPQLLVEADEHLVAAALEVEPALTFTSDAPLPTQASSGSTAPQPSLPTPVNSVCPVSGAVVNPTFAIVWKGEVIGFCCEKCAAAFWADPATHLAALKRK
jgi:uncharacterized membrane protein